MVKDGGLSFETQLKIEFLPPNNSIKKCLEKSLSLVCMLLIQLASMNVFYFM